MDDTGDIYRLYSLFGYETHDGKSSLLWREPRHFTWPSGQSGQMLAEAFSDWKQTKRPFTTEEVLEGYWIKKGNHGHSFFVKLFPDGMLVEYHLDNPKNVWQGRWHLVGVALRLNIDKYELDIFANKHGAVHSGIEVQGESHPYSPTYFQCTHVR